MRVKIELAIGTLKLESPNVLRHGSELALELAQRRPRNQHRVIPHDMREFMTRMTQRNEISDGEGKETERIRETSHFQYKPSTNQDTS